MQDNPITVTVHREDREPLNNRPCSQELIISDLFGDLLIKFDEEGGMTLRRVGTRDVVFLHLDADAATALTTAHLTWVQQIEAWNEHEAFAKAQKQAEAMTTEPDLPRCPEHDTKLTYVAEGDDRWYLCRDHNHIVELGDAVIAETQATREAAEQVVDLDPQRCVAVGCKEPALLRIGEFWYCAEHSKEPIPF